MDLEGKRKFRNFYGSAFAVQNISDYLCVENGLSIVPKKSQKRMKFRNYPEDPDRAERPFDLLLDIEKKLKEGKGRGYERWAESFNLKQTAGTLIFLQERGVHSMEDLKWMTADAADSFEKLRTAICEDEKQLKILGETKKQIVSYLKTRAVYAAWQKGGKKSAFYEAHLAELEIHMAAKRFFDRLSADANNLNRTLPDILKEGRIPTVREIGEEYGKILDHKKNLYRDYREKKEEMKSFQIAKRNVEMILKSDEPGEKKLQKPSPER